MQKIYFNNAAIAETATTMLEKLSPKIDICIFCFISYESISVRQLIIDHSTG